MATIRYDVPEAASKGNVEPAVAEAAQKLLASISIVHNCLISLTVVTRELEKLAPFTEKNKGEVLKAAAGGLFMYHFVRSGIRKKIFSLESETKEVNDAVKFLRSKASVKTGDAAYTQIINTWNKEKEYDTYVADITKYLSRDGIIRTKMNANEFDIGEVRIQALYDEVVSFTEVARKVKVLAERLNKQYQR